MVARLVPSDSDLGEASAELMGLSNAAYRSSDETNYDLRLRERTLRVSKLLGLRIR